MTKKLVLPEGHSTVNPFIITEDATSILKFIESVFDGVTNHEALTYDTDGLVLHSEIRVGGTTIMVADRKKDWLFTPSFLQVYVLDIESTIKKAIQQEAIIITKPTEYIGVRFARFQDKFKNIWWVYEQIENYDWSAAFSSEGDWEPTPESIYIHDTLIEALNNLKENK